MPHLKKFISRWCRRKNVFLPLFFQFRSEMCVPKRIKLMKKAISERDFRTFAETTMKVAIFFNFVACCLMSHHVFINYNVKKVSGAKLVCASYHSIIEKVHTKAWRPKIKHLSSRFLHDQHFLFQVQSKLRATVLC